MRRRPLLVLLAAGVIVCGLALQRVRSGSAVIDIAGTVLYAALIYLLVLFIRPSIRAARAFLITSALCIAIELAQLSPVPAWLNDQSRVWGLLLGTGFAWTDLAAYVLGAAICVLLDRAAARGQATSELVHP